jgi:hypothetical protein
MGLGVVGVAILLNFVSPDLLLGVSLTPKMPRMTECFCLTVPRCLRSSAKTVVG